MNYELLMYNHNSLALRILLTRRCIKPNWGLVHRSLRTHFCALDNH